MHFLSLLEHNMCTTQRYIRCRWGNKIEPSLSVCSIYWCPKLGTLSESERYILNTYPTFIALPFQRFHRADNPIVQSKRLQEVFTNIIKYLALVGVSAYFESKEKDTHINPFYQIELQRPKHSTWLLLIDLLCKHLPPSSLFVEELFGFWKTVHSKPHKRHRITSKLIHRWKWEHTIRTKRA